MNNEIRTQLCREDFYVMMASAVMQAGGAEHLSKWKEMKLEELVNILAHNGIRIVYIPEKHMDAIKIVWEKPVKSNNTYKIPDLPPKKKQLLCDQLDHGDEDDGWEPHKVIV